MYTSKELAESQRNSHIFDDNQVNNNIIKSPNYKRNERTTAYRYALQNQIELDNETKKREKLLEDEHPLEMKVTKYSLKSKNDEKKDEDQTWSIGNSDSLSKEEKRAAQAKYRNQLEADSQRSRDLSYNDDPLVGRKPFIRRPISPNGSFAIGQDEVANKQKKKQDAAEFYRQDMLKNSNTVKNKSRTYYDNNDNNNNNTGFNIGMDEGQLKALKALQKQEYRDALDEQKIIDEQRKADQYQYDRQQERIYANGKLPYSQH
mmetsp:Transcript_2882/g.2871  ORF Transcript_2882/g.2871 Transcript_2882/m.2871 type:complete len:261 (+) Transcript_2882:69-851(+)